MSTTQWENALQLIRQEVNDIQYETWFKPLVPIIVGDSHMYFELEQGFILTTMRSRYRSLIENAVMISYGHKYQVDFVAKGENPIFSAAQKRESPKSENDLLIASMLNPKYTFDTFVVGASNRFAHAASLAVAELPADAYNPLFLYGGVGLGKTHLMHAIGHYIHQNNPSARLLYITSENFTNQLITAIAQKTNQELRDRLRTVDVLMVDDIQFIAGKTATQEEFFHTFNELRDNGKQIIISSDRPPKEIPTLEERLRSRFEWGLIADIAKPDLETRVAILQKKAEDELLHVDGEVLEMIAERVASNIRELEGCLTRLVAYSSLTGRPIDRALAEEALKEVFARSEPRHVTCDDVMEAVATYYNVTVDDLKGPRRSRDVAVPRQIAMYIAREVVGAPLTMIGDCFGGRDHSTVNHACQKVTQEVKTSPTLNNLVSDLCQQLQER